MIDRLLQSVPAITRRVRRTFPAQFDEWCASRPTTKDESRFELASLLAELLRKGGRDDEVLAQGVARVVDAAANVDLVTITNFGELKTFNFDFPDRPRDFTEHRRETEVRYLQLNNCSHVTIQNAVIQRLRVTQVTGSLEISNCAIGYLHFSHKNGSVTFRNCWIGTMEFATETTLAELAIYGGGILNVTCPPPDASSPFNGSVVVDPFVLFEVSKRHSKIFRGAQSFRNLRAHLETLDNVPTANLVRALQLRSEREDERGLSKFLNWGYGVFSGYGSRPGRPLLWVLGLYLVAFAYIYFIDHGIAGLATDGDNYKGARQPLVDPSYGRLVRSLVLPLQSVLSPLGFLDARKTVVEATGFGTVLLAIQGVGTLVLLFLSGLAIRRRFKIT